jgi:hypothetical protein
LISYEAGQSYARLVRERMPSRAEVERLSQVEKHVSELEKKPTGGFITPIVLALRPSASLAELLFRRDGGASTSTAISSPSSGRG